MHITLDYYRTWPRNSHANSWLLCQVSVGSSSVSSRLVGI